VSGKKKFNSNGANVGYESELQQMAEELRGSMDTTEYKHAFLGLVFLKDISCVRGAPRHARSRKESRHAANNGSVDQG
jgi:type I restriction-modification system DNA methylase subunit